MVVGAIHGNFHVPLCALLYVPLHALFCTPPHTPYLCTWTAPACSPLCPPLHTPPYTMVTKDKQWWVFEFIRLSCTQNGEKDHKMCLKLHSKSPFNEWLLRQPIVTSMHSSAHISMHPSVHSAMHSLGPPLCSPLCSPLHIFAHPYMHPSTHLTIHPSAYPSYLTGSNS